MHAEAHDTMRRGLSALKDDAAVSHPVELIQGNVSGLLEQLVSPTLPGEPVAPLHCTTFWPQHFCSAALRAG